MKSKKQLISIMTAHVCVVCLLVAVMASFIDVDAASVKLNKTSLSLVAGKSATLKVKGTKKKVTWKTTDKKIAAVSNKGKVSAKKKGSAIVYAVVAGKVLTCNVTVKAKPVPQPAPAAPLSTYWSKGSEVSSDMVSYVSSVTDTKSSEFIPKQDRIAVFDMDGTLTCETYFTYYDTMMFIDYCNTEHPGREVSDELKQVAAEIKPGYKAGEDLARNFAKAYAGMTIQELYDYAVEFGKGYTKSFNNMRYIDGFYLPMVELVKYLYDNGFTIYVVSGTERTTTRAIVANSPISDYVSPNHVIGTEFEVKVKGHENESSNMTYEYTRDTDELVFTGGFVQKNLSANKPIYIEREIGRRPVLAFGNSGTDKAMMNYVIDSRNPYTNRAYMIIADDDEREWGKPSDWENKAQGFRDEGYIPISMKNDFAMIYDKSITKAEQQYVEPAAIPALNIGTVIAGFADTVFSLPYVWASKPAA